MPHRIVPFRLGDWPSLDFHGVLNDRIVGRVRQPVAFGSAVVDAIENDRHIDIAILFRIRSRAATEKDDPDKARAVQLTNAGFEDAQSRGDAWRHSEMPCFGDQCDHSPKI